MLYNVKWLINIEAENPRAAAEQALKMQRDPKSIATVFHVSKAPENLTDLIPKKYPVAIIDLLNLPKQKE